MTGPGRVRLSRRAGWRKPADAIVVGRGTRWGNPFDCRVLGVDQAVRAHARWLAGAGPDIRTVNGRRYSRTDVLTHLDLLAGRPLACWCPTSAVCHADTLLRLTQETHL